MLKNTNYRFGVVSIALHWLIALALFGNFGLGIYMTGVDYYHPFYQTMPMVHESIGLLLFVALLARSIWGWLNVKPLSGEGVGFWEERASKIVKTMMNLLVLLIVFCGLMLSFADGEPVSVFQIIEIPAFISELPNQEDWGIFWHYWLSWLLIGLACLHTAGALKHHFLDRDETLRRILGLPPKQSPP